ncbi:hypothetical protein EI94DRAFT_1746854 [Lactarius quietus]|nr:hypothetical protein EI94DRAFT_1746854 [Lactarius quietus]
MHLQDQKCLQQRHSPPENKYVFKATKQSQLESVDMLLRNILPGSPSIIRYCLQSLIEVLPPQFFMQILSCSNLFTLIKINVYMEIPRVAPGRIHFVYRTCNCVTIVPCTVRRPLVEGAHWFHGNWVHQRTEQKLRKRTSNSGLCFSQTAIRRSYAEEILLDEI